MEEEKGRVAAGEVGQGGGGVFAGLGPVGVEVQDGHAGEVGREEHLEGRG